MSNWKRKMLLKMSAMTIIMSKGLSMLHTTPRTERRYFSLNSFETRLYRRYKLFLFCLLAPEVLEDSASSDIPILYMESPRSLVAVASGLHCITPLFYHCQRQVALLSGIIQNGRAARRSRWTDACLVHFAYLLLLYDTSSKPAGLELLCSPASRLVVIRCFVQYCSTVVALSDSWGCALACYEGRDG